MLYLKFIFGKIAPDLIEFCTQNDLITDYKNGLGIFWFFIQNLNLGKLFQNKNLDRFTWKFPHKSIWR